MCASELVRHENRTQSSPPASINSGRDPGREPETQKKNDVNTNSDKLVCGEPQTLMFREESGVRCSTRLAHQQLLSPGDLPEDGREPAQKRSCFTQRGFFQYPGGSALERGARAVVFLNSERGADSIRESWHAAGVDPPQGETNPPPKPAELRSNTSIKKGLLSVCKEKLATQTEKACAAEHGQPARLANSFRLGRGPPKFRLLRNCLQMCLKAFSVTSARS